MNTIINIEKKNNYEMAGQKDNRTKKKNVHRIVKYLTCAH